MSVAAFAADPSGTYTFAGGRGGGGGGGGATPPQNTLVLALKDGKLTGTLTAQGRNGETKTEITNGSVTGDTVAFEIVREFNGNKSTSKYTGKITADAITGSVTSPGRNGGEPTTRDWVAKKAAAK